MPDTPATLPANFFANKTGQASPPQTLPANFDFKKGAAAEAPKPDTSAERGAAQATGLRAQQPPPPLDLNKLLDSSWGKERQQANVDAAEFGAGALMSKELYGMIGKAFKPSVTKVAVPTRFFDSQGQPIMHEIEKVGKSAVGKGVDAVSGWIKENPIKSYMIFELAKQLALSPEKAMKMVHVIGKE